MLRYRRRGDNTIGRIGVKKRLRLRECGDPRRDREHLYFPSAQYIFQKLLGFCRDREPPLGDQHPDFPQTDVAARERRTFEQAPRPGREPAGAQRIMNEDVGVKDQHAPLASVRLWARSHRRCVLSYVAL